MRGPPERHGLFHRQGRLDIGEDKGGRTVRDERAVRALERAGDEGIAVGFVAAELEAEILAHLREGIAHAVGMVLGGDGRKGIRLVAIFLEIALGDLAEDTGKAAVDVAFLLQVGGP